MSAQTKKTSKKNKLSPNDNELEAQFYVAQRAKSSRVPKSSKLSQSSNGNFENQEPVLGFSKDSIPYINKQIFFQEAFEETKETNPLPSDTTMETEEKVPPQNSNIEKEEKEIKEESTDLLRILESQYVSPDHLFREKESKEILDFIIRCIKQKNPKSLMVSGPPGTGKTLILTHLLEKIKEIGLNEIILTEKEENDLFSDTHEGINVLNINAAYCDSLCPILLEVIKTVNNKIPLSVVDYKANSRMLVDKLKQIILAKKPKKLNVIVIDEIDNLLGKQATAKEIADLLKIPNYPFSNIIFIITTNIIDLLPKLYDAHKVSFEVDQVTFEPYSPEEMNSIFKHRFNSLQKPFPQIVEDYALDQINWGTCLQKMKSLKDTDIRYITRIIRKAYTNKKQPEVQIVKNDNPTPQEEQVQLNEEDILNAYKELYDENLSSQFASMSQKHLMCLAAIVALSEKKKSSTITKKDILTVYNNSCSRLYLPKADLNGLTELLSLFEVYNIVGIKSKEGKEAELTVKEPVAKTPAKNANEEYNIKMPVEKIKDTLRQDGYFIKSFPE